jgi:hypothetical protein
MSAEIFRIISAHRPDLVSWENISAFKSPPITDTFARPGREVFETRLAGWSEWIRTTANPFSRNSHRHVGINMGRVGGLITADRASIDTSS